ncbi:MAG: DUF6531 domain-containing protein, partial [Pseudomonadota bacterium]
MMKLNLKCMEMSVYAAVMLLAVNLQTALGACSCEIGSGGSFIGMELTARDCPPENANDDTQYVYIDQAINCMGSTVSLFSSWGDNVATPAWLEMYYTAVGMRVFRNDEGTHFVVVHPNFKGKINGVSMSAYPGGGVYIQSAMDTICVGESPEILDLDGDGIPACQDCNDRDAEIGGGLADGDGDGVAQCYDCDDSDKLIKGGKGIDLDGDGYDQCRDCNDYDPFQTTRCETCPVGEPVDYFTGTMTHDLDLINLPGAPAPLTFGLHYDSRKDTEGALGGGWTHNHASRLILSDKAVLIYDHSRRPPVFFTPDGGTHWYPGGATIGRLEKSASGYIFTKPDAEELSFDLSGRLLQIRSPHGLLTRYAYNGEGLLMSVTDPSGRTLAFDYYPAGMPAHGLLLSVRDPAGHTFRFGYEARRLRTITYPDGDDDPANDPGTLLHYTSFPDEGLSNGADPGNLTKLVDPGGNALCWSYDDQGRAVLTTGPQGT